MIQKILLATDGSESAVEATRFLAALPLARSCTVRVVCVVNLLLESVFETIQPGQHDWARHIAEAAAETLREEGIEATTAVRAGDADHQILVAAEEWGADLVVLGSRGLGGLEGFLLGSVARNVAKHAPCSVLVARSPGHALRGVVLAVDGSPHARQAETFTAALPLPSGTQITVLNVMRREYPIIDLGAVGDEHLFEALQEAERERRRSGEELASGAALHLVEHDKQAAAAVRDGDPATEILKLAAEKDADLIIAGARGGSLIRNLLVGSVADRLLKNAPCSILIVR